jgi:hypothetical protein
LLDAGLAGAHGILNFSLGGGLAFGLLAGGFGNETVIPF